MVSVPDVPIDNSMSESETNESSSNCDGKRRPERGNDSPASKRARTCSDSEDHRNGESSPVPEDPDCNKEEGHATSATSSHISSHPSLSDSPTPSKTVPENESTTEKSEEDDSLVDKSKETDHSGVEVAKNKDEPPKGKVERKMELTSSDALLDRLATYVDHAIENNEMVTRKVLDALLQAINIQVQKEPLSVRKLIIDKQLVLPNTISLPPSQVIHFLIEHDAETTLQKELQRLYGDCKVKYSDIEKKERQQMKVNFGVPHMTKVLMDIGQDLVQESTYCDIVHARNLPEQPKNVETYKQVAAQLKPVWESLRKKNEPYRLKHHICHLCNFRTENRLVMIRHRSTPHFDGKKYQCTMCPEFDTNESRMVNHYIVAHEVVPMKEEPPLKNPCYVCDEDFQLKGQREAHFKTCKRDYQRIRFIQTPRSPDDLCMLNRWLWEKPPVDNSLSQHQQQSVHQAQVRQQHLQQQLQQQQMQQQLQQQLQQQHANRLSQSGAAPNRALPPARSHHNNANLQAAMMQQQLLAQQRLRTQMAAQAAAAAQQAANNPTTKNQNSLIAAMQKHLRAVNSGRAQAAVSPAASSPINRTVAAQHARTAQVQQMQQNQIIAAARQLQLKQQAMSAAAPATPPTPRQASSSTQPPLSVVAGVTTTTTSGMSCEICDSPIADKDRYLLHLQATHRQMRGKTHSDMQTGAPLACSRCRDRFWTYEGLERHLVMTHGLVTTDLLSKAQKKEDGGRCKICGKQYAFNMLQHLVADHQVKLCSAEIMYSCDVCAFKCQSYQKLEVHLATLHQKSKGKVSATTAAPVVNVPSGDCITLED